MFTSNTPAYRSRGLIWAVKEKKKWKKTQISFVLFLIPGFNDDADEHCDLPGFRRLNTVCGWSNTSSSAKISLLKFNLNSYISAWDLSTSKEGASDHVIPTVQRGCIRFRCDFSMPLKEELTMLIFSEHPSVMSVDHQRKIMFSFFTSLN